MSQALRIGDRLVGEGQPVFVIAEAGCNHENDGERAHEMIAAAAAAGADAIKFQSFTPDTLVTRDAPKFWDIPGPGASQYEEFSTIQPSFSRAQYQAFCTAARQAGILWFSTPCDEAWTDELEALGVPLFKIASMDLTHLPLLRHVAKKGKPIILSTGASEIDEIHEAVAAIRGAGNDQIVLLHCVSTYPTQPESVNLGMMHGLKRAFPECVIGYSDHTLPTGRWEIPALAVAAGARVIEKHFTFDRTRPGYDHALSVDYDGLKRMVASFREIERILGTDEKRPVGCETRARRFGRRSLVAARDIRPGEPIRPDMVAIKRPGTGIAPKQLDCLIGKVASRAIRQDDVLTWDLVGEA